MQQQWPLYKGTCPKLQYYANFDMLRSWVQSVIIVWAIRNILEQQDDPQFQKAHMMNVDLNLLVILAINLIPPELVINADQTSSFLCIC